MMTAYLDQTKQIILRKSFDSHSGSLLFLGSFSLFAGAALLFRRRHPHQLQIQYDMYESHIGDHGPLEQLSDRLWRVLVRKVISMEKFVT